MSNNQTMTVRRIDNQGDRLLLYKTAEKDTSKRGGEYYIIAGVNSGIVVGDVIEYEPYGGNFGWLVKKCEG